MGSEASSSEDTSSRDEIERPRPESRCDGKVVAMRQCCRRTVPWKDSSDVRSRNEFEPGIGGLILSLHILSHRLPPCASGWSRQL